MKRSYINYYLKKDEFNRRFFKTGMVAFAIFVISMAVGIIGFHYIVKLGWIDAFLNSSMILGGMGQIAELKNDSDKIFAGCYALFSGVAFLTSMAIFLSPLIHRFLQRFHMDVKNQDDVVE